MRLHTQSVAWRRYLQYAVRNVPYYFEPMAVANVAALFWAATPKWRRKLSGNLRLLFPKATRLGIAARVARVYHNFAWCLTDAAHFHEGRREFNWEFEGQEHFHVLTDPRRGAVVCTAHMGSYDLGTYVFHERLGRKITMVRAPEPDPETRAFVEAQNESAGVKIAYSGEDEMVSLELVHQLQAGSVVAVQGDRVTPGLAPIHANLLGRRTAMPLGPFLMAMVAGVPIYPLFIARTGLRTYRVITHPPIEVRRTGRDRNLDLTAAAQAWCNAFEHTLRRHWSQWFAFTDPQGRLQLDPEEAA